MTYRHNMEKVYNIKDTIRNYYLLNTELSLEGGPTNNGEKFVEKVEIEKEILSYFGLPLSSKYIKLIWNTFEVMENVNEAIPILLEELKEKAQEFELNKKKSMATKLQEGADNQIEAFDLFPDLQIDLNLYTLFIYNEMLVKKKEPIEKIIQELEKAKGKECLTDIYQLSQLSKNYEESDFYQSLKKRKLIYLDNFVDWCKLRDNQKINTNINLAIKNEDAIQSLCLAFRLFLHYKNQGYSIERAKKHSGLMNNRVFKIAQYAYTHS
ncbi:MAG TPA: hypothetical protein PLL02_00775 [Bacteroidales bacterium]|nr:hypothetical protein [Bacteroidales bacterium]